MTDSLTADNRMDGRMDGWKDGRMDGGGMDGMGVLGVFLVGRYTDWNDTGDRDRSHVHLPGWVQ